jgi:predicted nucleic-acid-binding protein
MRAVDTDVVVRYLTNDDPGQAACVRQLLAREVVFVPLTVLLETEWVLRAVYGFARTQVLAGMRGFAGLPHVAVENAVAAALALDWAERGLDFADALHLATARSHSGFLSFDKSLARAARKVGAPAVAEP